MERYQVVKALLSMRTLFRSPLRDQIDAVYQRLLHGYDLPALAEAEAAPHPACLASLPPVKGIFKDMVPGENAAKFVQLEHIVNELRASAGVTHLMLVGPPSVGKTVTAGCIARALERPYFEGNGAIAEDHPSVLAAILDITTRLWDGLPVADTYLHEDGRSRVEVLAPSVIFIDEAHELPVKVQNTLLPVLVSPHRAPYQDGYMDLRNTLFILGTTNPAQLFKPFRTRFRTLDFVGYSAASVAEMVRRKYPGISEGDAVLLAKAGKLYPRRALDLAQTCVELQKLYGSITAVVHDHMEVDEDGLDATDRRILSALQTAVIPVDTRKFEMAKRLVQLWDSGARISPKTYADAKTILDFPVMSRPMGRAALAEKIMSTDVTDIMERVVYLETIGKVIQSGRGVQCAPQLLLDNHLAKV